MAKIVVIGASQGGLAGLQVLFSALKPADLAAPVLVAMHIGTANSILPSLLEELDGWTAAFARHGEPLTNGHILVAPPDRHMLVVDGFLELSQGPRENHARPAIDPLFRTAAQVYGRDVIAILLSGRMNDGTAGLFDIKRRGGTVIVQTPAEAEAPDMPRSALENVAVDYCLPVREIPRLVSRLVQEPGLERIAGRTAMEPQDFFVHPTAQTCPECGGAMRQEQRGTIVRFRCHTGHVMTGEVLAAAQLEELNGDLSRALRRLNERVSLCADMAEKFITAGNRRAGERWKKAAGEAAARQAALVELIKLEWRHPEDGPVELPEPALEPANDAGR